LPGSNGTLYGCISATTGGHFRHPDADVLVSTNVFGVIPASVRLTDDIGRFGINYRVLSAVRPLARTIAGQGHFLA